MEHAMSIDRTVILDLLPLYLSEEASPETRALVEEHLDRDPDLARLAEQFKHRLSLPPPPPVKPDAEALAYREARRAIANRVVTLAIVISAGVLGIAGLALVGAMLFLGM
jgi:predicted anti-sigma-YlaC factor YlaD